MDGHPQHHSPSRPPGHSYAYTPIENRHARSGSGTYNQHAGVPQSPSHHYQYHSQPPSPNSTRGLRSSSGLGVRDRPTYGYYDPTSEARKSAANEHAGMNGTTYQPGSPAQGRTSFEYNHPTQSYQNGSQHPRQGISRHASQSSPSLPSHAHPSVSADPRPSSGYMDQGRSNGTHSHNASQKSALPLPPPPPPTRASNPMSVMNMLSDSTVPETTSAPPPPPPPPAKAATPPQAPPRKSNSRQASRTSSVSNSRVKEEPVERRSSVHQSANGEKERKLPPQTPTQRQAAGHARRPSVQAPTGPPGLTVRDTEAAYAEIQAKDLSDVEQDVPGLEVPKAEWAARSLKRSLELGIQESMKRKRRRTAIMQKMHDHFDGAAQAERAAYIDTHESEVAEEVRQREIEEDKERKKDQQRKRRREKALADEKEKRDQAVQQLRNATDYEEKVRLEKELQRHDKKIRDTEDRLTGNIPTKEALRESPVNPALGRREREVNMDGGLMTSFYSNNNHPYGGSSRGFMERERELEEQTPELPAGGKAGRGGRGGRGGAGAGAGRARKSKEQKQAEKDAAMRGQLMMDAGQDLPPLAPKEEERLQGYAGTQDKVLREREDSEPLSEMTPAQFDTQPTAGLSGMAKFESKGYNQIYEQITRDLAKQIPKVVRIKNNSLDTKHSNARKTAQLAAKEARRWQLRTNKSTKDVAARAKRAMREMLGFWKRNERDEREGRKVAERQELDKARKQEAEREANRQKRKLNFLISQTELYSHFIGKKVKTDEIEKHGVDGDVHASGQTTKENKSAEHTVDVGKSVGNLGTKVTNFEDLDFDAEDETALQEAAMANAQHAVQEAQDRARAFDKQGNEDADMSSAQQAMDEEGELNFQNPTSLQSMDIPQPKMLDCQLKEYQLKGLNWLVNLYEQGINGILADEMGLGKTVQSISVMAYLAEVHDIWGPFLVIAPASTLHNWQQEITRFVPNIKVLPYWGSAKDRKVLRKFWDRKHITYNRDSPFHVLVTSYQLVVQDTAYFQKVKWQYMILDEAQAIKSSQSSRWKSLLGFHCRNRLLLTGTPIQNNMQELWALLHFIMPSLFDSHDEFSEWFSKDIENHAQSNTKLNEDQLRRLHMILKPFMLRRVKKHVQKELGDKIEEDVFCDLTYRQRAYYNNLRNKISIMDLIEKAAVGDDQDTATLMNLVMQFRKVCNHPDLFERAEIRSPLSLTAFAETASFMREGHSVNVSYSVRNQIEYWLPRMLAEDGGNLSVAGPQNSKAGWFAKATGTDLSIWDERHITNNSAGSGAFSWLRFIGKSGSDIANTARQSLIERAIDLAKQPESHLPRLQVAYDDNDERENAGYTPLHDMLNIVDRHDRKPLAEIMETGRLHGLFNVSQQSLKSTGYGVIETCFQQPAAAPPIELVCPSAHALQEMETIYFNVPLRRALFPINLPTEAAILESKIPPSKYPVTNLLPAPESTKQRYTQIQVPSMRRFVTDSGKLAKLDQLLRQLKEGGHRVLLYFQMTRMIDLMEEYLTYRNYKYCRLDGSTKLEDRRDTVAAFQSSPDIFVFLLSTRAGGLGINLTSADTVIFYDSDWNPTIDSQAMDRAHRLGQTRQVTVYRLITRGTIEERIRKRALQKEEVQRVVISGQAAREGNVVDFNSRSRENNRTKEIAMWLADEDEAEKIEKREAEVVEQEAKEGGKGKKRKAPGGASKRKEMSMDDMYHEGEGNFADASHEPSGAATPVDAGDGPPSKKKKGGAGGMSKKAKTVKQRLAVIDGDVG